MRHENENKLLVVWGVGLCVLWIPVTIIRGLGLIWRRKAADSVFKCRHIYTHFFISFKHFIMVECNDRRLNLLMKSHFNFINTSFPLNLPHTGSEDILNLDFRIFLIPLKPFMAYTTSWLASSLSYISDLSVSYRPVCTLRSFGQRGLLSVLGLFFKLK